MFIASERANPTNHELRKKGVLLKYEFGKSLFDKPKFR